MKKKLVALLMAAVLLLGVTPALADAPAVEKIEYEGNGRVEVEFRQDVKYKNFKLKVTNDNGKKLGTTVLERDEDGITFKVDGIKAEKSYKVVISGVKSRGTSGYGKVKTAFATPAAPAAAPLVEDIEVKKNGRIEVDFIGKVQYKNLKVKIKDDAGKSYSVSVKSRDNDEINVKATGLAAGKSYTLVINGIRNRDAEKYTKIKIPFTTPVDYTGPVSSALKIRSVDSDAGDDEIEIKFNRNVQYGNLKVVVKTSGGKTMSARVIDRDEDSVEVRVTGLTAGTKYTVKVSGVKKYGSTGGYKTLTAQFTARND